MNNRYFFVFGGISNTEAKNDLYYYDIEISIWKKIHKSECQGEIPQCTKI